MVFETERLILRPWKLDDAEELYKYAKDPCVGPRAGWPVHTSVENSREIIETVLSAEGTYAVVLKDTNLPVGCIGIMHNKNVPTLEDEVEIGYWLGKPYWGQEIIPEACKVLIRYCFEMLGCSKIWASYYNANRNSCRVMQKCGFEFHHTEHDKLCELLNEYRTEHIVVLTKERWNKIQQEGFETAASEDDWTVNFEGGFWGDFGWGSQKVPVHQSFQYCDETCVVPYLYLCPEGVVIDYCVGIEPEMLDAFLKKWNFPERTECDDFTPEELEAIDDEHPLMFHFDINKITINGTALKRTHGCSTSYVPESCQIDEYRHREKELLPYLQRYDLDDKKVWKIERASYAWAKIKPETIESLELYITSDKKTFNGIHLLNPKEGDVFKFLHPVTGREHELTVLSCEQQIFDKERFQDDEFEYPKHFYAMQYQIIPDIPMENVWISDCVQSDPPKYIGNGKVIGGSIGVSAITRLSKGCRSVCSSMHFEPVDHIEWRMTFREKMAEDAEIKLI